MTRKRDLLSDIVTLARLIRTEADKRARAHGMTRAQWTILIRLEKQPGLLQKELAEILEVEPITVARLIDRHEARGMVERRPDPHDRRCWRLHLTEAARPLLGEIDIQLTEIADILCQGLSEETLAATATALAAMRDRAQELRAASPVEPGAADVDAPCPDAASAAPGFAGDAASAAPGSAGDAASAAPGFAGDAASAAPGSAGDAA
jgi:DNA-binding MarR family transcriptional regulator